MIEPITHLSLADSGRIADLMDDDWSNNKVTAVARVIRAYNEFVTGDPVGTIRRNPNGVVYERRERNYRRYWETLMPWPSLASQPIPEDPKDISDWQVIYHPEKS